MKMAVHSAICWLSVFTEALQLNLWLEIQFLYFCTLCKQERSFFPVSAALLSSPILHLASGPAAEILMGIASSIESIILSLLFSRSGLVQFYISWTGIILILIFLKLWQLTLFCSQGYRSCSVNLKRLSLSFFLFKMRKMWIKQNA